MATYKKVGAFSDELGTYKVGQKPAQNSVNPPHRKIQAVFPLEEGEAVIQLPATISQDSYDGLVAWIELVINVAKRSIKPVKQTDVNAEDWSVR